MLRILEVTYIQTPTVRRGDRQHSNGYACT